MAVLEKIRVKFGLAASIIIALGLLSFIIDPNELTSAFQSMSSKYDVGNINGKSISYTDFQADVEKFTKLNEMMSGSSAQNDKQQKQIRDAAWQTLIDKYLFIKSARNAGINVGDDEIVDLTTGDMISPLIAKNPAFADKNGNFSKEIFTKFVSNAASDENMKLYWNYIQTTIYTQQFYSKYNSLFAQSNIQNPLMLTKAIAENNNTTNVDFVMSPYSYAVDSSIVVSDNDIRNYYKNHKKFFKQQASRDIEYVVYEVKPSKEDISATNNKMSDIYNEFATTKNIKSFLLKNSDRPFSSYYYKNGELNTISSDINDFVFKNGSEVSGIFNNGNKFFAARVMATAMVPDSVYVRHILLQGNNADKQADSLLSVLSSGDSFSNIAALYSADKSSAADGEKGNLGWLTQTYMIPGFEGVMTAAVNKPFIIHSQYGTHLVEVTKTTKPVLKKEVAILEKDALASKNTFNDYYAKANKFANLASGSYQNYKNAVDTLGEYSHTMNNVLQSTSDFGSVENAKEVTRWIFDAKKGKVSNIITVNNNYFFVVALKNTHKEGYAKVNEVASVIKQHLYAERYGKKKAAEIAEKIAGLKDLRTIADTLKTTVSNQSSVAFASMNSQSLDPMFIGAVSVAKIGEISKPLAGNIGVYVYQVKSRDTGSFYTEDDAKNYQAKINQYELRALLPVMENDADVKDNRAKFY
ncbi:MAG: SurA N-terminal domain-containing protein [Bacteroidales bacterium]|jgi:peptidyl-prolyl cis-trans isomerase D|nr:SurA N-terminal domain-containing protein [Bacteroidales bacterium]MCI1784848.1 SurA N-terminal domain-containing protein [Bacteroidales bacterium]